MPNRYYGPALPPGGLSCPHALGAGSLAGTFKLVVVGMLETNLMTWPLLFWRSDSFSLLRHSVAAVGLAYSQDVHSLLINLLLSKEMPAFSQPK